MIQSSVIRPMLGGEEDVNDGSIRMLGAFVKYQMQNVIYKVPNTRLVWSGKHYGFGSFL